MSKFDPRELLRLQDFALASYIIEHAPEIAERLQPEAMGARMLQWAEAAVPTLTDDRDQLKARVNALERALRDINVLSQTPHTHLVDARGMRDLIDRLAKIGDRSATLLLPTPPSRSNA